jgi:hypothetical protein
MQRTKTHPRTGRDLRVYVLVLVLMQVLYPAL